MRWRDFMAWATPELLKKGSGEAAVASAVEDRLRQTLRAYADRHGAYACACARGLWLSHA